MSIPKGNWGFKLLGDGYFTNKDNGSEKIRISKGEYDRYGKEPHPPRRGAELHNLREKYENQERNKSKN